MTTACSTIVCLPEGLPEFFTVQAKPAYGHIAAPDITVFL